MSVAPASMENGKPLKESVQSRREEIRGQLNQISSKTSEIARFLAVGFLVIFFTVRYQIQGESELYDQNKSLLGALAFFAICTIFADYLQYVFGYLSAGVAYKSKDGKYDYKSWQYVYSYRMYNLKQICVTVGGILLIILFFRSL